MEVTENFDLTIIFNGGERHTITVSAADFHDFYTAFYSEKIPLIVMMDLRTSSTFAFKNAQAIGYIADVSEIQLDAYYEFDDEVDPDDYE